MPNTVTDQLLTADETAKRLRVHRNTLLRWADSGYGPKRFIVGGRIRYWESDVAGFLEHQYNGGSNG